MRLVAGVLAAAVYVGISGYAGVILLRRIAECLTH